jgi:hypothetical protein
MSLQTVARTLFHCLHGYHSEMTIGWLQFPSALLPESCRSRVTLHAAQEPFSQENQLTRLNDGFRVLGTEKCPNWTSIGNDRYAKLDGNSRLTMTDRLRCPPDSNFSVASVSNTDGIQPIERQLYGTSTVKIFLAPESCHPGAPASGRQEPVAAPSAMTATARIAAIANRKSS